MRRRYLFTLLTTVIVVLAALIAVLALQYRPKLGLDLQGGASLTLQPKDKNVPSGAIDESVNIIDQRVNGLGVAEPEINRQGNTIVVNLPGVTDQARAVQIVGQTATLRFRPVLQPLGNINPNDLTSTTTAPGTTVPGGTTTPSATTPATTAAAGTAPATSAGGTPGKARPPRQAGTTTATTAAPATTTATTAPATSAPGSTAAGATTTVAPTNTSLPAGLTADCFTAKDVDDPKAAIVLPQCNGKFQVTSRYYLGPAFLDGSAVETAAAEFNQSSGWTVRLTLKPGKNGIDTFNEWAQKCFEGGSECPASSGSKGAIAITLDGVVKSAPTIQPDQQSFTPFTRDKIIISGNFTEKEANDLALVLRYGSLPVEFVRQSVETVSATLGKDSLKAGIIAGLIGVGLVVLLMLLYYRALAVVVLAGLCVSFSIIWIVISILGETRGLALTLAGATGIIVSVGVTVDSYVVYFERMKDDVRAGRSLRTAAQKGFKGAWRTILAADIVSLIGAAILYWLTVSSVKGFAFFLGLSTLVDMFVAYFFTRPAVGLLSTTKWFDTQHKVLGVRTGEALATTGGIR